ncbi:general secretion pathway protein GspB [Pseudaeromonas paramecii]|uniref:Type II secretion system protein GspB C-terminal domain-containing protein n=1 Tax=Pseudaeromonas paramecii TaxID=2138166 RepID=A0ABP8QCE7_9GAMM
MSMLLKARRQGGRSAALEASLGLGLGVEQRSRRRLGWLLGLPLCLGLGMGANLAWHWVNLKPQQLRHEITEPTPLPYGPSETPARFLTRALPAPPAPVVEPDAPTGGDGQTAAMDLDGVSADLASRFQAALAAQAQQPESAAIPEQAHGEISGVVPLSALPDTIARRVPPLSYRSHVFSSDPSKRVVNLNGMDRYEGDEVAPGVVLLQILPEGAILRVAGQSFSLEALTDWPGVS